MIALTFEQELALKLSLKSMQEAEVRFERAIIALDQALLALINILKD